MEFELINGSKLEELLTNTVARLVITLPDGTKVELVNESQLREQIAREIEAKICYDFHCEPDEQDVCNAMRLSLEDAAALARGEG